MWVEMARRSSRPVKADDSTHVNTIDCGGLWSNKRAGASMPRLLISVTRCILCIPARCPMRYRIALHRSEEGYSVSVPGLPGCWSQGKTETEAIENIREAICEYLAVVEEQLSGKDIREIEIAI